MPPSAATAEETGAMTPKTGRDRCRAGWLIVLLALACVPDFARAAPPFFSSGQHGQNGQPPRPEPQSLVQPRQTEPTGISREQAAGMVQRSTGGRVLSTTPVQRGGGTAGYEVRVLVDGKRVKNVFVDERGNIRGQD
jgi:hypothetical protein